MSRAPAFRRRRPRHPAERDRRVRRRLQKANVKHELTVYPGVPHSFFDRKFAEFVDASADSWRRVQAFVRQNAWA
jgi:carboxymethylenebutenolidase